MIGFESLENSVPCPLFVLSIEGSPKLFYFVRSIGIKHTVEAATVEQNPFKVMINCKYSLYKQLTCTVYGDSDQHILTVTVRACILLLHDNININVNVRQKRIVKQPK